MDSKLVNIINKFKSSYPDSTNKQETEAVFLNEIKEYLFKPEDKRINEVLNIVRNSLRYLDDYENIQLDESFYEINVDELDMIEIIMECERYFNKIIPDDKWSYDIFDGTIRVFAECIIKIIDNYGEQTV